MRTVRLGHGVTIIHSDCREALPTLSGVDAVVTDPPYGLRMMNHRWDFTIPPVELWQLVLMACKPGAHLLSFASTKTYHRMVCNIEDAGFEVRDCIMWVYGSGYPKSRGQLKPAYEPIALCRKPVINSLKANVAAHGTGELNTTATKIPPNNRWPANFIHDGSSDVLQLFPHTTTGKPAKSRSAQDNYLRGKKPIANDPATYSGGDSGSAARYFYCPKASKKDRNEGCERNNHATVKPTPLMAYLNRLVTPVGGVILDPFMGSGSTGKAAIYEGFSFIGIERDAESFELAHARLAHAVERQRKTA